MCARINCGINPQFLTDQHLIAESVEITMITGNFRKNNYQIKSAIPEGFVLGKGHINFFKNKIAYLRDRLIEVNLELDRRGINHSTSIRCSEFPDEYVSGWAPKMIDSKIVRHRISDRLRNPLKAKFGFHRYYGSIIINVDRFAESMLNSPLYHV